MKALGGNVPYQLGDHKPPVDASKPITGGPNQTASDMGPQSLRTFMVNEIEQNGKLFQLNKIVTSKYTVFNFLPKNLID